MADTLPAAMAAVQAKLPKIAKNEKADTGKYSYTYASLADVSEAVLPLLASHGLSFVAMPTLNETGHFVLAYQLMHTSGDTLEGAYPLPSGATAQAQGSAITYARRYVLTALVGVAPEDDDGAAASAPADHETLLSKVNDLIVQLEDAGVEHDPAKIAEFATQGVPQAQKTIARLTKMLP